ncbi:MAG: hypothetical protein JXA69_08335 [Phycisphaerae bacterium]|nr:hypothetical protein [Phycisphaerae bacterium]
MEGSVDGVFTAGPAGSDGEGLRVMFCAPDYGLASDLVPEGGRVLVQLAAFAHHMRCEDIESEFVPTWWFKGSPGLDFGPDGRTEVPDPPRPIVAFSGRINGYQRRANPVTGLLFEHMRVETCIGEVDVVAAPDSVDGQIEPGRMALGEFWLTGRIVGGETGMFA